VPSDDVKNRSFMDMSIRTTDPCRPVSTLACPDCDPDFDRDQWPGRASPRMFVTGRSWVAPPVAERARAALGVLLNAVTFLVEDMSRSEFIKPLGGLAADGGFFR